MCFIQPFSNFAQSYCPAAPGYAHFYRSIERLVGFAVHCFQNKGHRLNLWSNDLRLRLRFFFYLFGYNFLRRFFQICQSDMIDIGKSHAVGLGRSVIAALAVPGTYKIYVVVRGVHRITEVYRLRPLAGCLVINTLINIISTHAVMPFA